MSFFSEREWMDGMTALKYTNFLWRFFFGVVYDYSMTDLGSGRLCFFYFISLSFSSFRIDSAEKLKGKLKDFQDLLQDKNIFAQIYKFTFSFAKEEGVHSLPLAVNITSDEQ